MDKKYFKSKLFTSSLWLNTALLVHRPGLLNKFSSIAISSSALKFSPLYKLIGIILFFLKKFSSILSFSINTPLLFPLIKSSTNFDFEANIFILLAILLGTNKAKLKGQYSKYLLPSNVSRFLVLILKDFFSKSQFLGLSPR